MKEFWDAKDSKLVINDRMTESGLTAYWLAVDATFKFNVSRRELFVAKQLVAKHTVRQEKDDVVHVPHKFANERSFSPDKVRRTEDPMRTFFKNHRQRLSQG